MRPSRAIAAIFALALGLAPAAFGQASPPEASARAMIPALNAHTLALGEEGYALAAGPITGAFARGRGESVSIRLWAGQDYKIAGVCDEGCSGLVLRLRDPGGALIAETRGAPLQVRPSVTGRHEIEARAARCTQAQCWFAVNVYAR
ncbi:MAG TPA: hypothetical protein PKY87_13490 [Terricaulis sp.]|nr:hypothetical protein [Terricaulis sp.]